MPPAAADNQLMRSDQLLTAALSEEERDLPGTRAVRRIIMLWGAARVGLGVTALLAPRAVAAVWVGSVRGPAVVVLGRALGGRDVALGLGTVLSAVTGQSIIPWVVAGGGADVVDAVATLLARSELPRGRRELVAVAAGGSALMALLLALSSTGRPMEQSGR